MFKKSISTLQKFTLKNKIMRATFSTNNNFYPDNIVKNLRANINNINEEELKEIETDIVNKINFFDGDQWADVVILLARQDKGSDLLWDVLSRKVFDYELDYVQSEALLTALNHTYKCQEFVYDDLKKNMYRYYSNQSDNTSKLFRSFYF